MSLVFEYQQSRNANANWQDRMAEILEGRPKISGVTIDEACTRIIDDGFMLHAEADGGWTLQASIAHASAMADKIPHAERGLAEGKERPALTFEIKLNRMFDVTGYRIYPSAFTSLKKCTHGDLKPVNGRRDPAIAQWLDFAHGLQRREERRMADAAASVMAGRFNKPVHTRAACDYKKLKDGATVDVVGEVMCLVNRTAARYLAANNAPAFYLKQKIHQEVLVSSDSQKFAGKFGVWCDAMMQAIGDEIPSYVRITSPLRVKDNLVMQHQISDIVEGKGIAYSSQDLRGIDHCAADKPHLPNFHTSKRAVDFAKVADDKNGRHYWYTDPFRELAEKCEKMQWSRPVLELRKIAYNRTKIYIAGIKTLSPGKGETFETCGIDTTSQGAIRRAAESISSDLTAKFRAGAPQRGAGAFRL